MPNLRKADEALFPLVNIGRVVQLFRQHLSGQEEEADLALLSIVAGAVEDTLTASRTISPKLHEDSGGDIGDDSEEAADILNLRLEPAITWDQISALQQKFNAVIKGYCDLSLFPDCVDSASRTLVKRVSDILWNTLSKDKIKDRTHLSNLYSYLTESKLDCFGVAFGVVAGCQVLGFKDVHLAMSEDHAWVVYGPEGGQYAEVTWHEKRSGDRRGEDVLPENCEESWVYAGGKPIVCTRNMEVAAIVSAMSPAISPTLDSLEVSVLQQELLWLLYDLGHLNKYPMALGNLGDLEESSPTLGRPSCTQLYSQAIAVTQKDYENRHIYPYMYSAGYYYRAGDYREALVDWAGAAGVLKHYSYSKEDEEIYKEFMEVNNEFIPHLFKTEESLLLDPVCFSSLIQFYDGLCSWEEYSSTPVLHIGWVKPMVKSLTQFEYSVRSKVEILLPEGRDVGEEVGYETEHWADYLVPENNNYKTSLDCSSPEPESMYPEEHDILDFQTMNHDRLARFALESEDSGCATAKCQVLSLLVSRCGETILDVNALIGGEAAVASPGPASVSVRLLVDSEQPAAALPKLKRPGKEGKLRPGKVCACLHSAKMGALRALLQSERINTSTLHLQLTAQSSSLGDPRRLKDGETSARVKRSRRE